MAKIYARKIHDGAINMSTGEAWKHADVRANCERESLKSRFSVPTNRTTNGTGTIIWSFK